MRRYVVILLVVAPFFALWLSFQLGYVRGYRAGVDAGRESHAAWVDKAKTGKRKAEDALFICEAKLQHAQEEREQIKAELEETKMLQPSTQRPLRPDFFERSLLTPLKRVSERGRREQPLAPTSLH